MARRKSNVRDVIAGLFLLLVAAAFGLGSMNYTIGTASNMGPGFFPLMASGILGVLALVVIAAAVRDEAPPEPEPIAFRALIGVVGSVAAFAIGMRWLGFVPAIVLSVLVLAAVQRSTRLVPTALLALGMSIGFWLIFAKGLGLPMPAFRGVF